MNDDMMMNGDEKGIMGGPALYVGFLGGPALIEVLGGPKIRGGGLIPLGGAQPPLHAMITRQTFFRTCS